MMYSSKDMIDNQAAHHPTYIGLLDKSWIRQWDAFVKQHPQSTFFHLSQFKTLLENYFNFKTYYLFSHQNDTITGILPLARVKSLLFSDALISVPFGVYGGSICFDDKTHALLIQQAKKLAYDLKVDYLELKQSAQHCQEGTEQSLYVTFRQTLAPTADEMFNQIPRKQRAMVRKGIKLGLRYEIETDVKHFYPLYSESLRNLGTPVQAQSYYQMLLDLWPYHSDVLTVFDKQTPVASVLSFYFKDQVLPFYGGGGALARQTYANDFMYWSLMNHALSKGMKIFDFGRSKIDSGSYRFKKHWGFEASRLHYRLIPISKANAPNLTPTNPKYQSMINVWKRMPLALTNTLGPIIARRLG